MVVYSKPPKVNASTRLVRPIFKPLFFIMWYLALIQNTTDQGDRQPHNVAVRALDPRDESGRKPLNCVGAGSIGGLPCRHVPRDVFVCHGREPDARGVDGGAHACGADERDAG